MFQKYDVIIQEYDESTNEEEYYCTSEWVFF
jgi:hypothetical protein